eukprot:INCI19679.1.p1 GENE.INCI19679.1~~INCI19679.1.p1  ORF type:complete len:335 (-),score=65.40 INCI19679.1:546-1550(-)
MSQDAHNDSNGSRRMKGTTGSGIPRWKVVLSREEHPDYDVAVPEALLKSGFQKLLEVKPFASAAVMFQAIFDKDDGEFDRCLPFCSAAPEGEERKAVEEVKREDERSAADDGSELVAVRRGAADTDRGQQDEANSGTLGVATSSAHALVLESLDHTPGGFCVDDPNQFGQTCLHAACQVGNPRVVQRLLEVRANPLVQCRDGLNALSYACRFGHADILPLLEQSVGGTAGRAAALMVSDQRGRSQVALAAEGGHVDCILRLAAWKADVNATDRLGQSPCHVAALANQPNALRALSESKADLSQRNTANKTPLMTAGVNSNDAAKMAIVQLMDLT